MSKFIALLLTILMLLPLPAMAISSNWLRDGSVDVRLISSLEGVGQKKIIPLGLEVRLEPGWHTYWRSPGGVGLPPRIDFSSSLNDQDNLKNTTIFFPAPRRFTDQGMDSIGYEDRVVFPIDAEVRQVGRPLNIHATVNLLACSTLCVPKTFEINIRVPRDSAIEGTEADVLNPWRAHVPGQDESAAGISLEDITNTGASLVIKIGARSSITVPDVFIESQPEIAFSAPEWKPSLDQLSAALTVKPLDPKQDLSALADTPLLLTIVDEGHAVEVSTSLPDAPDSNTGAPPLLSFRVALLLAIAGGFLLNLMPCVLPVLSLKIFSVIGHGGSETKAVRRSFLMTAAGIMFSFFLLAMMTLALKALGLTLGWGVQFQQPLFLITLILLLTFFTANMWGLLELNLPRFLAQKLSIHHPKMAGDFVTGALATLLATPCTAPFMGTAVGFALASGSAREIVAIFMALGFGMIIPYFSIAAFPEVAIFLPKPGKWMMRLRFLLGAALALTATWLLWVLAAQIMLLYAATVGVCMMGIVALLGMYTAGIARKMMVIGLAGFIAVAIALSLGGPPPNLSNKADTLWQPFDESAIPIQVASGRTVFVDITADWCLTCKANKKFVLSDDDISKRIFHGEVVAMQGNWTNPDPEIASFLHRYRHYGIPFNVVYGPGAPQGITLPEILSHDAVINALNKASTP